MQQRLIEDLLDMSRIISGKLVINTDCVDIAEVIDAALDSIRPAAMAKSIALNLEIEYGFFVTGDADRLQQVIWNLLSN
jgi:signal transduction histidine kinase